MDKNAAYTLRARQQQLFARMLQLEASLKEAKEVSRDFGVARVEDAPGRKMPFFGAITLPMVGGSLLPVQRALPVTQIGAFVVTALYASWVGADGRFRPTSSIVDNQNNPPVVDALDFVYQIKTSGTGTFWQKEPVPSTGLFGSYDRPRYLSAPEWLKPSDSLIVTATPIRPPPSTGRLQFIFLGYKNIDPSRWVR